MLKFLGFVEVYDLEVLLTHGHKVDIKNVNSFSFNWGKEYEIKYACVPARRSLFPVASIVAVNASKRVTHRLILWWKEGS